MAEGLLLRHRAPSRAQGPRGRQPGQDRRGEINTFLLGYDVDGDEIVVKPGKYGPYVKRGEDSQRARDPDTRRADHSCRARTARRPEERRTDRFLDGLPVFAKNGRFGPYVQWGEAGAPPPGYDKPKMASLFKTMTLERMTIDQATELLSLPRVVGTDPADGQEVIAANGRYGPYVSKGKETSLANEEQLLEIGLDEALALLAQPKQYRGRGGAAQAAAAGAGHRSRQRAAGRREGRSVRCLRHRR